MKKVITVFSGLFLCFSLFKVGVVVAADSGASQTEATSNVERKQQFTEERQQLQAQRNENKGNMEAARTEERELSQRMLAALKANDLPTATKLREELRVMHQENMQEMQQDKQQMQAARQGLRNDIQDAQKAADNNPPGPQGGPGTNWENRPGPQGGPGASPDRDDLRGRDDN